MNEFAHTMTVDIDEVGVLTLELTLDVTAYARDDVEVGQRFLIESAVWDEGREIHNPNSKPFLRKLVSERLDDEDVLNDIREKAADEADGRREEAEIRAHERRMENDL